MDPHAQYRSQAASTASPAQLVLMLYDGCLAEIDRAELALAVPRHDDANEALVRAQRIVQELTVTLDHDRGGEVAANLAQLYRFVSEQLVAVNLAKDPAPLTAVRRVVTDLRDAWATACVAGLAAVG